MKKYQLPVFEGVIDQPKNRIWICDVSGSMYGNIKAMTEDIVNQLDFCDPKDLLTVLWFSSEGLYGTIVKGVRIGEDKERIAETIRRQMYARSLTCFSDSLNETVSIVEDLQFYQMPYSLMFFSDGYPVVSNYTAEYHKIFVALTKLRSFISDCVIIGYGDWYNRQLLSEMAEMVGGVLVHADDIEKFSYVMRDHIYSNTAPRFQLNLESNANCFAVNESGNVVTLKSSDKGELFVPLNYYTVYELPEMPGKSDYESEDLHLLYAMATAYARRYGVSGIDDAIRIAKQKLVDTRTEINRARCAIILGNHWPEDLGSRDNNTIMCNGAEVKFDLTTERVEY